jgi:hypothetical protein
LLPVGVSSVVETHNIVLKKKQCVGNFHNAKYLFYRFLISKKDFYELQGANYGEKFLEVGGTCDR